MEFKNRKAVNDKLNKYDLLADKRDFIEVTEWSNGDGIDISINDKSMSLTYGQLEAINYLHKSLQYNEKF